LFLAPGEGDTVADPASGREAKEAAALTEAMRLMRGR
jgi:hypothetical protein